MSRTLGAAEQPGVLAAISSVIALAHKPPSFVRVTQDWAGIESTAPGILARTTASTISMNLPFLNTMIVVVVPALNIIQPGCQLACESAGELSTGGACVEEVPALMFLRDQLW